MKEFSVDTWDIPREGEIIKVDGKSYKVAKKTTTAIAVTRYYWFDKVWDKYVGGK